MNSSVGEEGKQGGVIAHETRYQRAAFGYHGNIPRETNGKFVRECSQDAC